MKIPLTKKKGGDKVADNAPPVFNRHVLGEELLKGIRSDHDAKPTSSRKIQSLPPLVPKAFDASSIGSADAASGHSTSSTALWIAASNSAAKKHKQQGQRSSDNGLPGRKLSDGSQHDQSSQSYIEEEYYEEEIVEEDFFEEEIIDELPPRVITIRFDEYDEMQTIIHINDYTKHEISRSWYKRDDYDKMVALARKTAEKVEERTRDLGRNIDKATKKKIEYRGLEAWTSMGSAKVKILKESAVEAVWNEQTRQWDGGVNDIDKIRELYQIVSRGAQQTAQDRGFSDELIVKRIIQIELQEAEKKRKRRLLGKSKALLGKSVKVTAGGVVKTAKLGVKTSRLTGKVAFLTGKMATKTAVATATFDRKMLKEAIIPSKKKRECKRETVRLRSQANKNEPSDDNSTTDRHEDDDAGSVHSDYSRDSKKSEKSKKKSKLRLLGMVPIPGTHKTYREDRRLQRIEKRIDRQKTRPAWEAGVSGGKY